MEYVGSLTVFIHILYIPYWLLCQPVTEQISAAQNCKTYHNGLNCDFIPLLCSVAFWVPFLTLSGDSYWLNKGRKSLDLQDYGVTFSQLFSLFPNGDGKAYATAART